MIRSTLKAGAILLLALAGAPALAQTPAPRTPATTPKPAPPTIDEVNAYFNSLKGLQASFQQMSPDGRLFGGTLYLRRPGLMRFEYDPPASLEIVADGKSVAIRDRKLNTQDEYFIGQTPLKFLLQPKIDITKDSKVKGLKREGDEIVLSLEDASTFGGTSRIRVVFDGKNHSLKDWTVTDPQGQDTRVMLSALDTSETPDRKLFVIERQRIINPN